MERHIVIPGSISKFYPYRKAVTQGWTCEVYLHEEDYKYLRRKLQRAGYQLDNHIVFCTELCNFWLSDNYLHIGGEVVEGAW